MAYEDEVSTERAREIAQGDPARAAAIRADSAITEIDWGIPDPAAVPFRFEAPSGVLAGWSLGDPGDPRVVLVPGVTGSKEDFLLLAPLIADQGYYVQSYDLAGQYESADAGPSPATGKYDYPLYLDDLEAFLRSGAPAHLLGYSFAGIVAQLVLARAPLLVRSLTLLTAPPLSGQVFRKIKIVGPFSRFLTAHQGAGVMLWGIMTNKNGVGPQRLEFVQSRFELTKRESVDDIIGLMMNAPDLAEAVRASGVPVLIATGEHDLWPVALHADFADRLGAELAVYHTGHSPCETTPHQLALDMVRTFRRAA